MDKKLELLAKTLLDASKIMFVSVFANYLLNSSPVDWGLLFLIILFIISIGYAGWIIHPAMTDKGEN